MNVYTYTNIHGDTYGRIYQEIDVHTHEVTDVQTDLRHECAHIHKYRWMDTYIDVHIS